jgi:hypothetical protein
MARVMAVVAEEGLIATEPPVNIGARAQRFRETIEGDGPDALWVLEDGDRVVGHADVHVDLLLHAMPVSPRHPRTRGLGEAAHAERGACAPTPAPARGRAPYHAASRRDRVHRPATSALAAASDYCDTPMPWKVTAGFPGLVPVHSIGPPVNPFRLPHSRLAIGVAPSERLNDCSTYFWPST